MLFCSAQTEKSLLSHICVAGPTKNEARSSHPLPSSSPSTAAVPRTNNGGLRPPPTISHRDPRPHLSAIQPPSRRQRYLLFPRFTLESGVTLTNVPVAFKTWGKLAPTTKDNALVVCHALTGSADVEDWWGPLLGKDKVFDYTPLLCRLLLTCWSVRIWFCE